MRLDLQHAQADLRPRTNFPAEILFIDRRRTHSHASPATVPIADLVPQHLSPARHDAGLPS